MRSIFKHLQNAIMLKHKFYRANSSIGKMISVNNAVCALWRSQMRFSTAAMRSRTAARI